MPIRRRAASAESWANASSVNSPGWTLRIRAILLKGRDWGCDGEEAFFSGLRAMQGIEPGGGIDRHGGNDLTGHKQGSVPDLHPEVVAGAIGTLDDAGIQADFPHGEQDRAIRGGGGLGFFYGQNGLDSGNTGGSECDLADIHGPVLPLGELFLDGFEDRGGYPGRSGEFDESHRKKFCESLPDIRMDTGQPRDPPPPSGPGAPGAGWVVIDGLQGGCILSGEVAPTAGIRMLEDMPVFIGLIINRLCVLMW